MDKLDKSEFVAEEGHTHGDVNTRQVTGFMGGSAPNRKPSNDPSLHHQHPINFPAWRKTAILVALAWSGFAANYCASAHLTAFPQIAESLNVPIPKVAETIGYGLLGIATGPIFWNPLSKTIGRRPVYLIGSVLFLAMTAWLAAAKSYESFAAARFFSGFFSAFSQTVPPASIADIYQKEVRGDKIAWYGLACIIAPSISPLICGLVVNAGKSWRVVYWIVFAVAGVQLLLFLFLVPETLWVEHGSEETEIAQDDKAHYEPGEDGNMVRLGERRAAWMPWHRPASFLKICWSPIAMSRFIVISLPSFYYGSLFAWSVGITIVTPQIFERPPYSFKPVIIGVTYLAYGVGSILGKWSGGIVADKTVLYLTKRHGGNRQPEYRLWALVPLLPFMFVGLFIVGITLQKQTHWIAPLIGGAVFYFCIVASTGILQTYVLETYLSKAQDTQAIFIFFKALWGFAVTFFAMQWQEATSLLSAFAIQGALAAGLGALICFGLIFGGYRLRLAQGMPVVRHDQ